MSSFFWWKFNGITFRSLSHSILNTQLLSHSILNPLSAMFLQIPLVLLFFGNFPFPICHTVVTHAVPIFCLATEEIRRRSLVFLFLPKSSVGQNIFHLLTVVEDWIQCVCTTFLWFAFHSNPQSGFELFSTNPHFRSKTFQFLTKTLHEDKDKDITHFKKMKSIVFIARFYTV